MEVPERARLLAGRLGVTGIAVLGPGGEAGWGETRRPVNVRSVRKSLVSALYGAAAADTPIDLGATLEELGIDDRAGLSRAEKRARVRDLLTARSGVYHPAAYESPEMKAKRPARGAHAPGSHWYYNNWDFNALGTIYERLTGEALFESFARRIAAPAGMEDFSPGAGRRVVAPDSVHPAQLFSLSARDLALFGRFFLEGGRGAIPAAWIAESTRAHSRTDLGRLGYGYLWWIAPEGSRFGPGAIFALGAGGQGLAVLPAHDLVVAQVADVHDGAERLAARDFMRVLRLVLEGVG